MKRLFFFMLLLWSFSLLCHAHDGEGFVSSDLLAGMKPGDRAALLMVHFGTSYDDTRAMTIDAINAKAKAAFPELEMREAYTSRIIIRRLKKRDIEKQTPLEALLRLRSEGYTHIIVQSTNIIEGVEMESLRHDVESVQHFFKEIRIGTPLLYSTEDSEKVVCILGRHLQEAAEAESRKSTKEHFVLVGHGTYTPITATYSQVDYMLKAQGFNNFHVGTIEGYPTFDTMLAQLKAGKARNVTLAPFMFVAGDHARNDIAKEWKERLEKEGFSVSLHLEGLGQIPEIQEIYIDHIHFLLRHRMVGIMEKKAGYSTGEEAK